MRGFKFRGEKLQILKGIVRLILIFTVVLNGSGCHRKVGVKSEGQSKTDKSKCKCKTKKGGIYVNFYNQRNKHNNTGSLQGIDVLG